MTVYLSKVFRSENSVHCQDKKLYHVQGSYLEKLRTEGPGGKAPRESRGVCGAAGPSMVGKNLEVLTRGDPL